jgi:3-deoxy-D-manno-octulosonate 8-phosphate phosphatase (KDO 8-P phosphatase)
MPDMQSRQPIDDQIADVRLLVLDVDGVMTDGRLYFDANGEEAKVFHVRDGFGIKQVMAHGIEVAVISGRRSTAVERRMAELNIRHFRLGQDDKLEALEEICESLGIPLSRVACVGDDLPDLPVLRAAGLGIAVADAHPELLAAADWSTQLAGGRGCVREVCDRLLQNRR